MKGALVTRLARPGLSVINTHPLANADGDWSEANRYFPAHRAQLAALGRAVASVPAPVVVCGDFNIDRDSVLFIDFMSRTALEDAFDGTCPPTFRAEYLPPGARPRCIDFILAGGEVKASSAEVLFTGQEVLRGDLGTSRITWDVGAAAHPGCLAGFRADPGSGGIYSRLADLGHAPDTYTETARVRPPDDDEAQFLRMDPDQRVVAIQRTTRTAAGRIVEVNQITFPAHQWELVYEWSAE